MKYQVIHLGVSIRPWSNSQESIDIANLYTSLVLIRFNIIKDNIVV
jgi:hypothetical protein